uniref:Rab-GAP TBC domain-containing protein n=1 Tax=Heterorhabditis bacteriophora TaxID=37862 RepID=A0A1I7WBN6_HETBA
MRLMPSISEPPTPIHSIEAIDDLFVASCIDLNSKIQVNSEDETSHVLRRARCYALRTKRETIGRFLRDHAKEDLTNYIDDLRSFARSNGGLIDDEYRSIIWPILSSRLMTTEDGEEDCDDTVSSCTEFESAVSDLSDNVLSLSLEDDDFDIEDLKGHKEWHQVLSLDFNLKFFHINFIKKFRSNLTSYRNNFFKWACISFLFQYLSKLCFFIIRYILERTGYPLMEPKQLLRCTGSSFQTLGQRHLAIKLA